MTPPEADSASSRPVDWLRSQTAQTAVPSWLVSGLFHAVLAFCIVSISQMASCRGDYGGEAGESFRTVGLRSKSPADEQESDQHQRDPAEELQPAKQVAAAENTVVSDSPQLADRPPVPLQLPSVANNLQPVIGAGLPNSIPVSETINDLIRPTATTPGTITAAVGGAVAGGGPVGGTSFLGVQDVGRRFVYVIDRSNSMYEDNRLQDAKEELLASVERLNETQQFQIIFYNNEFEVLRSRDKTFNMFWGSDAQRLQVAEQLRGIGTAGGTRHLPAILEAFRFNPDVIFLLTDGANDSALFPKELDQIRQRNRGSAHIHCIEFGKGPKPQANFLTRLAEQNGGQYVYRDVSRQE